MDKIRRAHKTYFLFFEFSTFSLKILVKKLVKKYWEQNEESSKKIWLKKEYQIACRRVKQLLEALWSRFEKKNFLKAIFENTKEVYCILD